jgi:hypothetical protein
MQRIKRCDEEITNQFYPFIHLIVRCGRRIALYQTSRLLHVAKMFNQVKAYDAGRSDSNKDLTAPRRHFPIQ